MGAVVVVVVVAVAEALVVVEVEVDTGTEGVASNRLSAQNPPHTRRGSSAHGASQNAFCVPKRVAAAKSLLQ